MQSEDRKLEEFVAMCRRAGLKATQQRMEIFRELMRSTEHPDAETLCKRVRQRVPSLSLDTLYRTLRMLEEKGVIHRVRWGGERARFDPDTKPHHHFICTVCGRIEDVHTDAFDHLPTPVEVEDIGQVDTTYIELRGRCRSCQEKEMAAAGSDPGDA
jgi:Fur family peroxide stress response transcriptional regulator